MSLYKVVSLGQPNSAQGSNKPLWFKQEGPLLTWGLPSNFRRECRHGFEEKPSGFPVLGGRGSKDKCGGGALNITASRSKNKPKCSGRRRTVSLTEVGSGARIEDLIGPTSVWGSKDPTARLKKSFQGNAKISPSLEWPPLG